jgi:hypothetical protein
MPEYQRLTNDELLHLAEAREQLTNYARLTLDGELQRRKLSSSDVESYRTERASYENTEKLKRLTQFYFFRIGLGMRFCGRANLQRDPSESFEQYDTTLWFVALWFPVFPVATYTVRRVRERWWGGVSASEEIPIERHPRNWEQILLTWVKASAVVLALRLAFLALLHHPEWFRHLP